MNRSDKVNRELENYQKCKRENEERLALEFETLTDAEKSERYIAELEYIIYTTVRLTDIMREGLSEATYNRIHEKYDPQKPPE